MIVALLVLLSAHAGATTLAWDISTDPRVVGYKIHSGAASRSYATGVNVGNSTTYTLPNLAEGSTTYFAVTAYDASGNESPASNEVAYFKPYNLPIANFTASTTSGQAPLALNFVDASAGVIADYAWNFGDGNSSASPNPAHVYNLAGTYTVSLTVTGPGGFDTLTRSNYIRVTATPGQDTTPPSAPATAVAVAGGTSSINLSWVAATDNVGVTGYRIERC
jgi:PKD repeat protein